MHWWVVNRTIRGLNVAERNGPHALFNNWEGSQLVTCFDT